MRIPALKAVPGSVCSQFSTFPYFPSQARNYLSISAFELANRKFFQAKARLNRSRTILETQFAHNFLDSNQFAHNFRFDR